MVATAPELQQQSAATQQIEYSTPQGTEQRHGGHSSPQDAYREGEYRKVLDIIQAVQWCPSYTREDELDVLSLLSHLEQPFKAQFWRWLVDEHPITATWLKQIAGKGQGGGK